MNIVREDVDALNAILKVEVAPADYQGKVKTTLEKYRKTSTIKGFRPGHIPMGLIKKQYGKAVISEELNKVVNENLQKFITENEIEILGNPIPSEKQFEGDFDNPTDFSFEYQIGLAPEFKVNLSKKNKYEYTKVKIDKKLIDKQVDDLRRRYGKLVSADEVEATDMIMAQFVELNDDKSIKEGGILNSSTISMEFIKDKKVVKSILGKKAGDKVVVDPTTVSKDAKDTAAMLGVSEEELANVSDLFEMTVTEVKRMELAELNAELFDKLFGEGNVKDEKELRARVKSDLNGMFEGDSDKLLTRKIYDDLIAKTKMEFPKDFLKRWIKLSNEKEITDEQIESDFENYLKTLKWQLIQSRIFKTQEIKLENAEVIEFTKGLLVSNYAQYGMPAPGDEELMKSAMQVLQNKEEANRVYDMLAETKLTTYFKDAVKLEDKEVAYDDFVEMFK